MLRRLRHVTRRFGAGLLARLRAVRVLRQPLVTRRHVEALDNFAGLRRRLDRENQLHALMLSQRHFRRGNHG